MKIGVIGNDQMVISCLEILCNIKVFEIVFVLYDKNRLKIMNPIDVYCEARSLEYQGLDKLNTSEIVSYISCKQPDYLFSIYNHWIISVDILAIPKKGTINFHFSSPSKYRGLNIPSWVIINGEETHGVMWHFVEPTIDTGDVLVFTEFPLTKNEIASSLMVKCINKGIELFPVLLTQIQNSKLNRIPQLKDSSYYGKKDYPDNLGYIDFNKSGSEIDRLVRGLNYLPFQNTFLYAKIKHNDKEVIVSSVEKGEYKKGTIPGKIVFIDEESFYVECQDSIIKLLDVTNDLFNEYNGWSLANYLGVSSNDIL